MNRRRILKTLGAGGAATLLAACAGLGGPTVITLGQADLERWAARTFPMQRRVLELLDVQLIDPRLRLLPERNRLALSLSLRSRELLTGHAMSGRMAFDSALRYDVHDAALRLTQVRVQELALDAGDAPAAVDAGQVAASLSGPGGLSPGLGQRVALVLAERALEDLAIYRVSPERLADLRRVGLQPGAVTVTARGVEITLARISGG